MVNLGRDSDAYSTQQDAATRAAHSAENLNELGVSSTSDSVNLNTASEHSSQQLGVPNLSRPLSRSSITSGLSVTATKDGVEGKRIKRIGIPGYPLELINQMQINNASNNGRKLNNYDDTNYTISSPTTNTKDSINDDFEDMVSTTSVKSLSSMIPIYAKDTKNEDDILSDDVSSNYIDRTSVISHPFSSEGDKPLSTASDN